MRVESTATTQRPNSSHQSGRSCIPLDIHSILHPRVSFLMSAVTMTFWGVRGRTFSVNNLNFGSLTTGLSSMIMWPLSMHWKHEVLSLNNAIVAYNPIFTGFCSLQLLSVPKIETWSLVWKHRTMCRLCGVNIPVVWKTYVTLVMIMIK